MLLGTLALYPSCLQILTAGWQHWHHQAPSTAQPTPAALGIHRHLPAETECPAGCRGPGFSSLCRRSQCAHFSSVTKSALITQYRLVWVGQPPSPLTAKSPQRKEFKICWVRRHKVHPFSPIGVVLEDNSPGSDTFSYNCLCNFIDHC